MKLAIIGYGKMGKEIEKISNERGHSIDLIIDHHNHNNLNNNSLKEIDVAFEFSTPNTAFDNYIKCFESNTAVVSGSTGWLEKLDQIKKQCTDHNKTFFYASNFSLGVNIAFEMNRHLAKIMNQYNHYGLEIEEIHHTQKLDAPSGTAISFADDIILLNSKKESWINDQTSQDSLVPIISKRIENVPGTHTIKYTSDVDQIIIKHESLNRKGFALGAVLAAEFINGKTGFYEMKDLLNF